MYFFYGLMFILNNVYVTLYEVRSTMGSIIFFFFIKIAS